MSLFFFIQRMVLPALLVTLALASAPVVGGPGAHGPNGEHLDDTGQLPAATSDAPRLEAHSEAFEVVATLAQGELSIVIDRFASNEPVLGAQVEVSTGALKAPAIFHADHGDYAVSDPAFTKALSAPGEHALVFTLQHGEESDLLDGVLKVGAPSSSHTHKMLGWEWLAAGVVGLIALVATGLWRRRSSASSLRKEPA